MRGLFADPVDGRLVAMDSIAGFSPAKLRRVALSPDWG